MVIPTDTRSAMARIAFGYLVRLNDDQPEDAYSLASAVRDYSLARQEYEAAMVEFHAKRFTQYADADAWSNTALSRDLRSHVQRLARMLEHMLGGEDTFAPAAWTTSRIDSALRGPLIPENPRRNPHTMRR